MTNRKKFKTLMEFLHDIFDEFIEDLPYLENGNFIVIRLDDDRRVKLCLYNTFAVDTYNSIKMSVVSKTHGNIDTTTVMFGDIFENPNDIRHPNKINKHIWRNDGYYSWYGLPEYKDYVALRKALSDYIETWR